MPNLVIVSNRLPVSVKKVEGKLEFSPSTGGLATGLSSYAERRGTKWIGWPGLPADDLTEQERKTIARELRKSRCYPVFLTQKQIDDFYTGYSNTVLWPLMHNLPLGKETPRMWKAYREVNALYAGEVLRLSKVRSNIWIHDYQLLLMPELLRQAARGDTIGFFLHIPFPEAKILTRISQAKSLLRGMLGADLLGFHTHAYAKRFMDDCEELLGSPVEHNQILVGGRTVRIGEFPMGIDYDRFSAATRRRTSRREARKLRRRYKGQRIIVSVDRLDLTKGLVERVKAYQELLKENPGLVGKIVMIMIVAPSRTDVEAYKRLKIRLDKAVEAINHEFGTDRWQPIDYIYEAVPIDRVMTYYQIADIGFVAPLVDGMNLVAKEFVASKRRGNGVLILSETAGAAEELRDAVLVNPNRPGTMVKGLQEALTMPRRELKRRTQRMNRQIKDFSVQRWAESFMETLQEPIGSAHHTRTLGAERQAKLVAAYQRSHRRLLLLDYDGVLRQFTTDPRAAVPTKQVRQIIEKLAADPDNDVMVVSGRSRTDLSEWFGDLPVAMAAEHGALIRRKGGRNWHHTSSAGTEWKYRIAVLFERYAQATPGARVEQKEWAIVWHYRGASPYYTQKNLVALRRLLKPLIRQYGLQVLEGNKILEVRPSDVNKRRAVQEWIIHDHDFVLAIGDDTTDEDMFTALPVNGYSIRVGRGVTAARFRLKDVEEVLKLLGKL